MLAHAIALMFATSAPDAPVTCSFSGKLSVIDPDGKPLEKPGDKAVVYVKKVPRKWVRHLPKTWTVKQLNKEFVPSLSVILEHDTVVYENDDNIEHSVFSRDEYNTFELPRSKKGDTGSHTFGVTGTVLVQCDIHEKMRNEVVVVQNEFHDQPKEDGSWKISGLPPGDYELVAWEVNGASHSTGKLHCEGETPVELPVLHQLPKKATVHKNGHNYVEPSNTY